MDTRQQSPAVRTVHTLTLQNAFKKVETSTENQTKGQKPAMFRHSLGTKYTKINSQIQLSLTRTKISKPFAAKHEN